MILSDDTASAEARNIKPEVDGENSEPAIMRFTRLFKRDIWCWASAIQKRWWLFAIFPLLFASVTFFIRTMTTTNIYVANCGLIRQEITNNRGGVLPPG